MSTSLSPVLTSVCDRVLAGTPDHTPPAGVAIGAGTPSAAGVVTAGSRNLAGDAFGRADLVDVASVTKVVATTAAIMRLVTEGALALDDRAATYVPMLSAGDKTDITIRDLLSHRAGLWQWQPLYLSATNRGDRDHALGEAADLPLRYPVGSGRHYSDLGFMLLGEIIARVSAQPLDRAVDDLVLAPLGLNHTGFVGNRLAPARFVTSAVGNAAEHTMVATGIPYPILDPQEFNGWRKHPLIGEVNDGNAHHTLGGVSGHAGLFAPISDLLRFATAMSELSRWEHLYAPAVVQEFFSEDRHPAQALGFRREQRMLGKEPLTVLGHPGFTGCVIGFVPERGIALALASNRLLTSATPMTTQEIWDLAMNTLLLELKEDAS